MFTLVKDSDNYCFKIANPTNIVGPVTFEFTPAKEVENVQVDDDPDNAGEHSHVRPIMVDVETYEEVLQDDGSYKRVESVAQQRIGDVFLMQGLSEDGFIWIPPHHRTASVIVMANWFVTEEPK